MILFEKYLVDQFRPEALVDPVHPAVQVLLVDPEAQDHPEVLADLEFPVHPVNQLRLWRQFHLFHLAVLVDPVHPAIQVLLVDPVAQDRLEAPVGLVHLDHP